MIALEGVSVIREGNLLLNSVDWQVRAHERWVVFGPNGAGKTTLLQVASAYLSPSRGIVEILGARRGKVDIRTIREHIGYAGVAMAAMVRRHLPAVEIVVTGKHAAFVDSRWHHYTDADWARARALLAQLHAGDLEHRTFGTLSAGERQRVMIARSLMPRPSVLLLDEAATGLDLGARERLVAALADLADDPEAPATVLVTHHVEEIPPGFDHVLLLAGGEVLADGPLDTTLTSETVSACFETNLVVEKIGRRYRAWSPGQSPAT